MLLNCSLGVARSLACCLQWKQDSNVREIKILRRYHIQHRDDYHKYNKLAGNLKSFAHKLTLLPADDPVRLKLQGQMLGKLYDMGVLNSDAKMSDVENKLTVAAFCRRRLAVVMVRLKMSETVSAVRPCTTLDSLDQHTHCTLQATKFIEQGHVRVGPDTMTDPAYLVTRCYPLFTPNLVC